MVVDHTDALVVTLPVGYRDARGELHIDAAVAPLTGRDEEALAQAGAHVPLAALITRALSGGLRRIGPYAPVTTEMARALAVADREHLMLALRQRTFGSRVQLVLVCPACDQKMDVEFPVDPVANGARRSADRFALGNAIEFRLPTGADQEQLAARTGLSEAEALDHLIESCVIRAGDSGTAGTATARALDPDVRRLIADHIERLSPRVDLELELTCPECAHAFVEPLDIAALFLSELGVHRDYLYRDVHRLAAVYHWSESDILSLTREKRHLYLQLIAADAGGVTGS